MSDSPPSGYDPLSAPRESSARDTSVPGKGFRIGEYIIEKPLGHGSMATVYLAHDGTGHEVALKIFQEGPGVSLTMLERFRREAEASKKLRRHPNIMKVYATGQEGPYHYIVMEPVRNSRTLDDCIETNPMSIDQIVTVVIKIAGALQFAHTRNIVHRDVKPTNIMIDEFGEPLLTDFGVAALIDWPSCTISGALTGTPLYMSPEQARAERVGPESDIYSLGVVLYEALTGMLPYHAQHSAPVKNVLEAVKSEQPKRPRAHRKDISPDLEAVILKALEKTPEDRYPDAQAFAHDLERALAGRHVSARLFSMWEHIGFFLRKHDRAVAAIIMVGLLVGGVIYHFHRQLISARYDSLLFSANLRSFASRMIQDNNPGEAGQTPGAWPEVRMARRAMNRADWPAATGHLEAAVRLSRSVGDIRTIAMATLDLARVRAAEGDYDQAIALYQEVLNNPDAPAAVTDYALVEALTLALLVDRRTEAITLLQQHAVAPDSIFRSAVRCLAGELTPERCLEQIAFLPRRMQNDAHLAVAARHRMNGDTKAYREQLRHLIASSSPANEWPAPLARRLYEQLRD
jgi:serine/threonine protein kinase